MKNRGNDSLKVTLEINRRYEVMEMHLFDTDIAPAFGPPTAAAELPLAS